MKKKLSFVISFIIIFTLLAHNIEIFSEASIFNEDNTGSEETSLEKKIIIYHKSKPVEHLILEKDKKLELLVGSSNKNKVDYQWQILVEDNMWVDISGETEASILLSYPMVVNLLENHKVSIRAKGESDKEKVFSQPIEVELDYSKDEDLKESTSTENKKTYKATKNLANERVNKEEKIDVNIEEKSKENDNKEKLESNIEEHEEKKVGRSVDFNGEKSEDLKNENHKTEEVNGESSEDSENMEGKEEIIAEDEEEKTQKVKTDELDEEEDLGSDSESLENGADDNVKDTHSIVIDYKFLDGTQAAPSYIAIVAEGSDFKRTVDSPEVLGYEAKKKEYEFNIEKVTEDITKTIFYEPAEVKFTVKHLFQNVDNDEYTEGFVLDGEVVVEGEEKKKGTTESPVGKDLEFKKEEIPGFYALNYDDTVKIAADGSTVIEIKYDRRYFLMEFDLVGGYGIEPIYARYQTPIHINKDDLNKVGHSFKHWERNNQEVDLPEEMPAEVRSYKAVWEAGTVEYTVVYWYEDADPNEDGEYAYSYAGQYKPKDKVSQDTKLVDLINGDLINNKFTEDNGKHPLHNKHFEYNRDKTMVKANKGTVKADGTSQVNIYFSRNTYTLVFNLNDSSNTYNYQKAEITKDGNTYPPSQYEIIAKFEADIEKAWPLDEDITQKPMRRTGFGGWWSPYKYTTYYLRGWQLNNTGTINSSKRFTLTDDLISTNWQGTPEERSLMYANWTSTENKLQLNYYVESFIQARGDGRTYREGKWFDLSDYSQEATDTGADWSPKTISGLKKLESLNWVGRDRSQNFYYERNRRDLSFVNVGEILENETYMFEQPLKESYFEPEAPDNLEYGADAYYFDGWYTTANAIPGTKFNFDKGTMPDRNLALYANWQEITREVNLFQDENGDPIGDGFKIEHGEVIPKPADPTKGNYEFVGWFYKDKDGTERAFNFSMPVYRDMNLYAKWRSNTVMDVTIKYAIEKENGELGYIAEPTKDSGLAGDTKTYRAKFGEDLYENYQKGYFPKTASRSITIDIEDESKNEYTFIYVEKESLPYKVRYLEEETNNVLADEKYVEKNKKAVVTEEYARVKGYRPDGYQKRLILSAEGENILTFYYVKDTEYAPIKTTYYQQNIVGDDYTEVRSEEDLFGKIGEKYSAVILEYAGFTLNEKKSVIKETSLTDDGYEFELYYDRIEYPYEFQFLGKDTDENLADPIKGNARYGASVQASSKNILGYTLNSSVSQSIKIAIEDSTHTAEKNIAKFYYTENEVTISYIAIGPEGSGTVDPEFEKVKAKTGEAKGSTAIAEKNFKFVGWFKDKERTKPVSKDWVDGNNKITPHKNNDGLYESATYYAKFEKDIADLTIRKKGSEAIDDNQSFLFNVKGKANDDSTKDISLTVTVEGNGSVKINNLPVGEYEITEDEAWSWRYKPDGGNKKSITITADGDNTVVFNSERKHNKWLNGFSKIIKNILSESQ